MVAQLGFHQFWQKDTHVFLQLNIQDKQMLKMKIIIEVKSLCIPDIRLFLHLEGQKKTISLPIWLDIGLKTIQN